MSAAVVTITKGGFSESCGGRSWEPMHWQHVK